MKKTFGFVLGLILSVIFFATAAQAQSTIELLSTFSYPGSDVTYPTGIDGQGNIVGFVEKKGTGALGGFLRHPDGTFAALLKNPNRQVAQTTITGINNRQVLIGEFKDGSLNSRGFFFHRNTIRQFTISSAHSTYLTGLNDANDFAGYFDPPDSGRRGFVSIGGLLTIFDNPGIGTDFRTGALNNAGEMVGDYEDLGGTHGFLRDQAGNFTTIDAPGATDSHLLGLNDDGEMVGYVSTLRTLRGFYFKSPDTFIPFDYPVKGFTVFTAINDQGTICGEYYDDRAKVYRGLVARVSSSGGQHSGKKAPESSNNPR